MACENVYGWIQLRNDHIITMWITIWILKWLHNFYAMKNISLVFVRSFAPHRLLARSFVHSFGNAAVFCFARSDYVGCRVFSLCILLFCKNDYLIIVLFCSSVFFFNFFFCAFRYVQVRVRQYLFCISYLRPWFIQEWNKTTMMIMEWYEYLWVVQCLGFLIWSSPSSMVAAPRALRWNARRSFVKNSCHCWFWMIKSLT